MEAIEGYCSVEYGPVVAYPSSIHTISHNVCRRTIIRTCDRAFLIWKISSGPHSIDRL